MALNYSMADIRAASTGHFFDRKTMKAFGDTMKCFRVLVNGMPDERGIVRFYRCAGNRYLIGKAYKLDTATGTVTTDNA